MKFMFAKLLAVTALCCGCHVQSTGVPMPNAIQVRGRRAVRSSVQTVRDNGTGLGPGVERMFRMSGSRPRGPLDKMAETVKGQVTGFFDNVENGVEDAVNTVATAVDKATDGGVQISSGIVDTVARTVVNLLSSVATVTTSMIDEVFEMIGRILFTIADVLSVPLNAVVDVLTVMMAPFASVIGSVLSPMGQAMSDLLQSIGNEFALILPGELGVAVKTLMHELAELVDPAYVGATATTTTSEPTVLITVVRSTRSEMSTTTSQASGSSESDESSESASSSGQTESSSGQSASGKSAGARSRRRRDLLTSIPERVMRVPEDAVRSVGGLLSRVLGLVAGTSDCAQVIPPSLPLLARLLLLPVQITENIVCYALSSVSGLTREGLAALLRLCWAGLTEVALPWLDTTLNSLAKSGALPPNVVAMITAFDTLYRVLKMFGYI